MHQGSGHLPHSFCLLFPILFISGLGLLQTILQWASHSIRLHQEVIHVNDILEICPGESPHEEVTILKEPDLIAENGEPFPWDDIRLPKFIKPIRYA